MYVDDLVTRNTDRSKGFGKLLFDWLVTAARTRRNDGLDAPLNFFAFLDCEVNASGLYPRQSNSSLVSNLEITSR